MNGGFRRSRYSSDKFEAITDEARRDGARQTATKEIVENADRSIEKADTDLQASQEMRDAALLATLYPCLG